MILLAGTSSNNVGQEGPRMTALNDLIYRKFIFINIFIQGKGGKTKAINFSSSKFCDFVDLERD